MPEVLLVAVGPNGNIQAVVEADENVCYFYLFGAEGIDFGMRSVWVRNHSQAPVTLDVAHMKEGGPPKNPAAHCRHPEGLPPLRKEHLRVVWLPEGDGAALYESDELLAIQVWLAFIESKVFELVAHDECATVGPTPVGPELRSAP